MRPCSRRLFHILNSDGFDPVELLEITLVGQNPADIILLTDAGYNLTWNGATYYACHMSREQLEEKVATQSGEVPTVAMTINNVDRQMARLLSGTEVEGAQVTLRMAHRGLLTNPRDAVIITMGEMRDVTLSDTELHFNIVNVLGQAERIMLPRRIYQAYCNYIFGAPRHCGVNISAAPITLHTTVQAGTTDKFIVVPMSLMAAAGNPEDPNDFWASGIVVMEDGPAGLQNRPIQRIDVFAGQIRIYLRFKFLESPNVGDPVAILQNCRRTKEDCVKFQGNALQFGGFVEVPPVLFKPQKAELANTS